MERKIVLLLTYLLISIGLLTAQISKVTGVVKSADDGEPIIGATILVEGTSIGTVTDMDGKFGPTKLLQKREMRKDIVIELSYKGFSRASDYS